MEQIIRITYYISGSAVFIFFLFFARDALIEEKRRAFMVSQVFVMIFGAVWLVTLFFLEFFGIYLLIFPTLILIFLIMFFLPLGRKKSIKYGEITERVDERDVIFSREKYIQGTEIYDKYYSLNPEFKEVDDKIRSMPRILDPGGKYYDPVKSGSAREVFEIINGLRLQADGEVNPQRQELEPEKAGRELKKLAVDLGAKSAGIAPLDKAFVYTHHGRRPDTWGKEIFTGHNYSVVFTVEMDYLMVQKSPYVEITEETAHRYLQAANIAIGLAKYIRTLGYSASVNMDACYEVILPPLAYFAGLGELGRHGYLIIPETGSRARLGAVTTDMPLEADKPINIGVQDFCEKCLKCAENCPSGAIPSGQKECVRGVEKWQLDIESCMRYWRVAGTDCGLCMKVCPFSHPRSFIHNAVRKGIKNSSFARTVSVFGDDLFYGKREKY
ncbi:reductive dehalogenase [candidate division KSB1 bacterium]